MPIGGFFSIAIFFVTFIVGIIFAWKKKLFVAYPIFIPIVEKRGDMIRWIFDKGRATKDKTTNTPQLELKNSKETMGYPAHEEFGITPKGKLVLPLYSPAKGDYQPIKIDTPSTLRIVDKDILFWNIFNHCHENTKVITTASKQIMKPHVSVFSKEKWIEIIERNGFQMLDEIHLTPENCPPNFPFDSTIELIFKIK